MDDTITANPSMGDMGIVVGHSISKLEFISDMPLSFQQLDQFIEQNKGVASELVKLSNKDKRVLLCIINGQIDQQPMLIQNVMDAQIASPPQIHKSIRMLVRNGFLSSIVCPQDRRQRILSLTPKLKDLISKPEFLIEK